MKNITRIIAAMALSVMLSGVSTAQVSVWDSSAEPWTHGSGTEEDPYLIESAANLAWIHHGEHDTTTGGPLHTMYWNTFFLLTTDLDLGGEQGLEWEPIGGVLGLDFAGHFDGGHHTVDNMRITLPNGNPVSLNGLPAVDLFKVGLFGTVAAGSIRNLTMGERCVITIDEEIAGNASLISIGMLAGMVATSPWWSDEELPYLIYDCHNHGSITMAYPDDRPVTAVGGLVGYTGPSLRMENCSNSGALSLELPMRSGTSYPNTYIAGLGGLVGVVKDEHNGSMWYQYDEPMGPFEFVMEDCHNTGSLRMGLDLISYETYKRAYAGGVVGNAGYRVSLNRCSNRGDVTVTLRSSTGLTEYDPLLFCSGIAGGYGNDYRYHYGDHWAQFVVNITNCYNHAPVRCEVEEGSGLQVETVASGITGLPISESELVPEVNVSNCYHVGELSAGTVCGITPFDETELLGVNNCYYLEGDAPDNGLGEPTPDETMRSQAFVDMLNGDGPETFYWDQWEINGGYPVLDKEWFFLVNSEWYYEILNEEGGITYQHLQCVGDTTIDSHKAKVIVRTNQIYDKEGQTEVTHEYIYEHEGVVYWWNKDLQEFTVLYEFNADEGDGWVIEVGTQRIAVHVDAVEQYEYDGRSYRMLRVSDPGDVFSGSIVCGIGHLTSFFPEKLMGHKGYRVEGMRCYWSDGTLVFKYGDRDCDEVYQAYHNGVYESLADDFRVYPNPTDGLLRVERNHETSLEAQPAEYRITNVLGQTVQTGTVTDSSIDVSALPQGVYFLTMEGHTVKLMKQ